MRRENYLAQEMLLEKKNFLEKTIKNFAERLAKCKKKLSPFE